MKIEDIARTAHNVNKSYCEATGDTSQVAWESAPEWQRQSAITGVKFIMGNPGASPAASHESWLAEKTRDGWKYGVVKDVEKKEHPCFVPYEQLPVEQKAKDYIFGAVVRSLIPYIGDEKPQINAMTASREAVVDNRSFEDKIRDNTVVTDDGRRTVDLGAISSK